MLDKCPACGKLVIKHCGTVRGNKCDWVVCTNRESCSGFGNLQRYFSKLWNGSKSAT
jgi:hypothetical protein